MLKIIIANRTKAFSKGYVISKTKVKQNFLLLVIDCFKKSTLEAILRKVKKGCPKNKYDIILTKE